MFHYRWQATNYSFLWGMTLDEGTKYRLGKPVITSIIVIILMIHCLCMDQSHTINVPQNLGEPEVERL